ncbi:MAG: CRISPR-associated helicase Cas3' [Verrucomicrobia bacterium]|nr:CRISPR-associated helicase Cas3' [Verrucomicrobiota bacterium]
MIGKSKFEPGLSFEDAWGFKPYPFQKDLVNWVDEPGVYVVEAPMGAGKTEAALFAAYQLISRGLASGLFFALPTQVTSNRIHERVERFLRRTGCERPEARLIHSGSWLVGGHLPDSGVAYPGETEWERIQRRRWFASGRKALVAPYGVGTIDQALLGIIAVKFFFVRQFALAGKVVVLDEVHSYDAYTGGLLALLVRRLRELQCTVIILSATLTKRHRQALLPEDQAVEARDDRLAWLTASTQRAGVRRTACDSGLKSKPIKLRFESPPGDRVVAECLERAAAGQCVLWICNTVDSAILTRKRLLCEWQDRDEVKRPPIGLLHSRFPWHRRQQLEIKWLRRLGKGKDEPKTPNPFRPQGCVLVSTQVVEQSVDIDADFLVTELAPTDMLFQRLGRLWRHEFRRWKRFRRLKQRGSAAEPEAVILSPDLTGFDSEGSRTALGKWARVYDPFVLARSWRQWRGQPEVTVPDDIRSWLEATYTGFDSVADSQWSNLHDRYLAKRKALGALALNAANIEMHNPREDDEDRAHTRLQTLPTAELLLAGAVVSERPLKLVLLDGTPVTLFERHFAINRADALAASRAIHRNVVKLPACWLADVPKPSLPALNQHFYGLWNLAVRQPRENSGDLEKLTFPGGMPAELRLAYHPHEGVVLERVPTPKREYLDDDRFQFDD